MPEKYRPQHSTSKQAHMVVWPKWEVYEAALCSIRSSNCRICLAGMFGQRQDHVCKRRFSRLQEAGHEQSSDAIVVTRDLMPRF